MNTNTEILNGSSIQLSEYAMEKQIKEIFRATLQSIPTCQFSFEVKRDRDGDLGFSFTVFNVDPEISEHGCIYVRTYGGLPNTSISRETDTIIDVLTGKISANQFARVIKELRA